ncbi:MAG: hypothetical protein M0Q51_08935 [Bacteroidales bacterium]|nr:hypothetical protein [Bacteroidales bacterium]
MKTFNGLISSALVLISTLIFLLLGASTCSKNGDCPENSHDLIEIKNNSSITINWRHFIPDSIYSINGSTAASDLIVNPNSSDHYGTRDCWDVIFKDDYFLYFLIFNNDTVQAIGWQAISGTNRGLLKRVKVDSTYLYDSDFIITYP